jgi:hypothetical protein
MIHGIMLRSVRGVRRRMKDEDAVENGSKGGEEGGEGGVGVSA